MIKALALVVDEHKIIRPLDIIKDLQITYSIVDENFELTPPFPDIILTVSDWRADIARVLIDAKSYNIPTLLFQDGTLDWIIQNKGILYAGNGGATHFHPILTDKIAVMGHQSARVISSWNDATKVEVVGYPILQSQIDEIKNIIPKSINKNEIKVLVTSTRQAGFCIEHKEAMINAFKDLKKYFDTKQNFSIIWRLSGNISEKINVKNQMKDKVSSELSLLIKESDIVISAQSTVVIEAMLHKKPVAIIDYLNSPQYYPTAWFINSKNLIDNTIKDMIKRNPNRMLFQELTLNDTLFMDKSSISQAKKLIFKMVDYNKKTGLLNFPTNILDFNSPFYSLETKYKSYDIFPKVAKNYTLENEDMVMLITRYRHENRLLRNKSSSISQIIKFLKKIKL